MLDSPANRLTGLLSIVALALLLLAPVMASAVPLHPEQTVGSMSAHSHHHSDDSTNEHFSCWQQCLSTCASHCGPLATALTLALPAASMQTPLPPDLYQPIFPPGLQRPPKA
ncbi:hypothetical protein [Marinobacterium sp. MBR-109]|uniref:hypothetical protein n=1 Tax=Marinobacterium sp. MBR-109 TaxID=3156462 RepID=UPI0033986592